jgi:alcohol dehydrogenase class IV
MVFEFATASRIVFGAGAAAQVAPIARELGRKAMVVTGRSPERAEPIVSALRASGVDVLSFAIAGEPDIITVELGRAAAQESSRDVVIGIGGGSVVDTAKAIAALATNDGPVTNFLEVVGQGQPLSRPPLPCVAVPTTAGTGSEVTRNAVIGAPADRVKVSLRHAFLLPRAAIVDPDLTVTLPPAMTATTGLDALAQLIEPYVSRRANPMTDALCLQGIRLAATALPAAIADGGDRQARASMALASLWSGMALANAGLGAVHGFAGPIGGRFPAPHGAICAALLPHVMDANVRALESRAHESPVRARFVHVARWLTGHPAAGAADGVEWIRERVARFGIPPLASYGISAADVPELVAQASRASSMKANPIVLTPDELSAILLEALSGESRGAA